MSHSPYAILAPPYVRLHPLALTRHDLRTQGRKPGSALVWQMELEANLGARSAILRGRPGGLALVVILPSETSGGSRPVCEFELHGLRPQGILPHHVSPDPGDLAQVLKRPPLDLAGEVTDYLRWRGIRADRDSVRLVRRILDLSAELRSVSSVSRSMYISRRALGRRLTLQGLPVPSHWLQLGRVLRVAIKLQNSDATVASVAFDHGYPDGFSLSNQMERLVGHRPSEVRNQLGWEWIVEAWLRREAESGRLRVASETSGASAKRTRSLRREQPHQSGPRAERS